MALASHTQRRIGGGHDRVDVDLRDVALLDKHFHEVALGDAGCVDPATTGIASQPLRNPVVCQRWKPFQYSNQPFA